MTPRALRRSPGQVTFSFRVSGSKNHTFALNPRFLEGSAPDTLGRNEDSDVLSAGCSGLYSEETCQVQ